MLLKKIDFHLDDLIVTAGEDEFVMAVSSREKLVTIWAKIKGLEASPIRAIAIEE